MSRRVWKHRVSDIIDSIQKIQKYVEEMEFDDFQKDAKTIDAVIRNFIIIGEAARHVPDEISTKYPVKEGQLIYVPPASEHRAENKWTKICRFMAINAPLAEDVTETSVKQAWEKVG
jgi:glyoxylate utilization-related uncharacterized protein